MIIRKNIQEIAYLLRVCKEENLPKPIFFIGAGMSKSGGFPLANEIVLDIQSKYGNSPSIQKLSDTKRNSYPDLISALNASDRNKLIDNYANKSKINVAHLYLAQLYAEKFIDYVLTVNFDDLPLQALSLINIFPPVYDLTAIGHNTTSRYKEKAIIYLHGRRHGNWMLNTPAEMETVIDNTKSLFNQITPDRPLIFIGYSGNDRVFESILKQGRFQNGLYWVSYLYHKPVKHVYDKLLNADNNEAYLVDGYDADGFMYNLNYELGLKQPQIFTTPFSLLKERLEGIIDIEPSSFFPDDDKRLHFAKEQVAEAISRFEGDSYLKLMESEKKVSYVNNIEKKIINLMVSKQIDTSIIEELKENKVQLEDDELNRLISKLLYNEGVFYIEESRKRAPEEKQKLLIKAISRFRSAFKRGFDISKSSFAWGVALHELYPLIQNKQHLVLKQAVKKFECSIENDDEYYDAYIEYGKTLGQLSGYLDGQDQHNVFLQMYSVFQKAVFLNSDDYQGSLNLAQVCMELMKYESNNKKEFFYEKADLYFQKSSLLKPIDKSIYNSWALLFAAYIGYTEEEKHKGYYHRVLELTNKALEIDKDCLFAKHNKVITLINIARFQQGKEKNETLDQALSVQESVMVNKRKTFIYACIYALKEEKEDALYYLKASLDSGEKTVSQIRNERVWTEFLQDKEFNNLLSEYE
jgi:hypothetical protein